MWWVEYATHMTETRNAPKVLTHWRWHNLEDLGLNRRTILKKILENHVVRSWTALNWLKRGSRGGILWIWWLISEFQNNRRFLYQLNAHQFFYEDPGSWTYFISYSTTHTCLLYINLSSRLFLWKIIKTLLKLKINTYLQFHFCSWSEKPISLIISRNPVNNHLAFQHSHMLGLY
jgi:hypothetical protein